MVNPIGSPASGSLNVNEQPLEKDYLALVRAWKQQQASA